MQKKKRRNGIERNHEFLRRRVPLAFLPISEYNPGPIASSPPNRTKRRREALDLSRAWGERGNGNCSVLFLSSSGNKTWLILTVRWQWLLDDLWSQRSIVFERLWSKFYDQVAIKRCGVGSLPHGVASDRTRGYLWVHFLNLKISGN